ncbi:MAG: recombination protein NinG [Cellvibrionaceae bacterium]
MAKTLRAKCLEALQLLVRVKAANDNGYCKCVTCGIEKPWNEMDGGHFIPKGSSSYLALVEENVHPQCKGCNGFGMKHGSAAQEYTLWMIKTYGKDEVDRMLADKRNIIKIYKKEYEEMLKDFNEQIKYHKKRIGA